MASKKTLRYLIEAMCVWLITRLLLLLSLKHASNVGGWAAQRIGPRLNVHKVAARNMQRAFPEYTEEKISEQLRAMWDNLGRTAAEFPHLSRMSFKELQTNFDCEGAEILRQLQEDGIGGIIFAAHIANWEAAPLIAKAIGLDCSVVYRRANNPYVDSMICNSRTKHNIGIIPKGVVGARQIISEIKQGNHIGMLVDQKMNDGIPIPFFGRDAMTAPALAQLALKYNIPVVPIHVVRSEGAKLTLVVSPPLDITKTGDHQADIVSLMTRVNQIIEGWVREHPSQWFWVHKRWIE